MRPQVPSRDPKVRAAAVNPLQFRKKQLACARIMLEGSVSARLALFIVRDLDYLGKSNLPGAKRRLEAAAKLLWRIFAL